MESWKKTWREGFAPLISTEGLLALERALVTDDSRLMQGRSVYPDPTPGCADWPPTAACAVGFGAWIGDGLISVGEVEAAFAASCAECDRVMGEPAASRYFLNQFDSWGRDEMRSSLLPEVRLALRTSGGVTAGGRGVA